MEKFIENLKIELLSGKNKQAIFDHLIDEIENCMEVGYSVVKLVKILNENESIISLGAFRTNMQRARLKRKNKSNLVKINPKNNTQNQSLIAHKEQPTNKNNSMDILRVYPDIPDRQLKIVLKLIEENKLSIDELKIIKKTHRSSLLLQTKLNQLNK